MINHNNQQWVQYYCQVQLSESWSLQGDTGFRWREGLSEKAVYLFRVGARYSMAPSWHLGAGVFYSGSYGADHVDQKEIRPYQDVTYNIVVQKIEVNQRLRVESRFLQAVDSGPNDFRLRLRYNLSATLPLFRLSKTKPARSLNLIVGDEIFLHAESRAFDRNRLIIGPSLRWSPSLQIGLQWCSQYAATPNPLEYQQTGIVWLTVRQQFRLRTRKTVSS